MSDPTLTRRPARVPRRAPQVNGHAELADLEAAAALDPAPAFADDRDFIASLARGMSVLLAFSPHKRRMSIAQVSHRTGIPRAAVRRSLHTLSRLGFVGSDDARRFFLRPRVMSFGFAYLSGSPLALRAQPILDRLSETVQESCSLGILDGTETVYLARSTSSRVLSPTLNVGSRLPAYCTSIGLVLLACLPDDELDRYLGTVQLVPFTDRTITSRDKLRQQLKAVRQSGYALADQLFESGLMTLAVPVRDTARAIVGGINVIVRSDRVAARDMPERFLHPLEDAAHELGMALLP